MGRNAGETGGAWHPPSPPPPFVSHFSRHFCRDLGQVGAGKGRGRRAKAPPAEPTGHELTI